VILSDAKTPELQALTERAIYTALENSRGYRVNVVVMEQNNDVMYENSLTYHHNTVFNYNAVANLGAKEGKAPYIMIANNDLIFKENWLRELFKAGADVMSPRCPVVQKNTENQTGTELYTNLNGWCIMLKRSVWKKIGGFDEDFEFWFADISFLEQLRTHNIESTLVANSLVEHLVSQTLNTLDEETQKQKTYGQKKVYDRKFNPEGFNRRIGNNNRL
jgi:hypothetical protein